METQFGTFWGFFTLWESGTKTAAKTQRRPWQRRNDWLLFAKLEATPITNQPTSLFYWISFLSPGASEAEATAAEETGTAARNKTQKKPDSPPAPSFLSSFVQQSHAPKAFHFHSLRFLVAQELGVSFLKTRSLDSDDFNWVGDILCSVFKYSVFLIEFETCQGRTAAKTNLKWMIWILPRQSLQQVWSMSSSLTSFPPKRFLT